MVSRAIRPALASKEAGARKLLHLHPHVKVAGALLPDKVARVGRPPDVLAAGPDIHPAGRAAKRQPRRGHRPQILGHQPKDLAGDLGIRGVTHQVQHPIELLRVKLGPVEAADRQQDGGAVSLQGGRIDIRPVAEGDRRGASLAVSGSRGSLKKTPIEVPSKLPAETTWGGVVSWPKTALLVRQTNTSMLSVRGFIS